MNFFSLLKRNLIFKFKKKISIDNDNIASKSLDYLFHEYGSDKANIFKLNQKKGHGYSIYYEKKGRSGKGVTIIKDFQGNPEILDSLSKEIKTSLGIGGSVKKGEIILQGRIQEKVMKFLNAKNYKTKKVGG